MNIALLFKAVRLQNQFKSLKKQRFKNNSHKMMKKMGINCNKEILRRICNQNVKEISAK